MQYPANPYMNQMPQWQQERMAELQQRIFGGYQQPQYGQQFQPQQQFQAQQQNQILAMPVTGLEEAKAHPISFDDKEYIFVDRAAGKIYLKKWDRQTGGAAFSVFAPEAPQEPPKMPESIQATPEWKSDIERLEGEIQRLEGMLNAKSDGDANAARNGSEKPATKKSNAKLTEQPKPDGGA